MIAGEKPQATLLYFRGSRVQHVLQRKSCGVGVVIRINPTNADGVDRQAKS
jgi:hypothetical protein